MRVGFSLPFGPFPSLPLELAQLPLELLRAQRFPGYPAQTAKAIEAGPVDLATTHYLPQRMGFRRWKTPGWNPAWDSAVSSPIRAYQASGASKMTNGATNSRVAMTTATQAAQAKGALRLPQPSDNIGSFIQPIAKGLPPRLDRVPPTMLDNIAKSVEWVGQENAQAAHDKLNNALSEARGALASVMGVLR